MADSFQFRMFVLHWIDCRRVAISSELITPALKNKMCQLSVIRSFQRLSHCAWLVSLPGRGPLYNSHFERYWVCCICKSVHNDLCQSIISLVVLLWFRLGCFLIYCIWLIVRLYIMPYMTVNQQMFVKWKQDDFSILTLKTTTRNLSNKQLWMGSGIYKWSTNYLYRLL